LGAVYGRSNAWSGVVIYLEFIERDRWMPIEIFRLLGDQEMSWVECAVDKMVLQLGRTLRLGPQPSYLCLWDIADISRLDDWEAYFQSVAARQNWRSQAMHRAIHIARAGLYDTLQQDNDMQSPLYVVEYCAARGEDAKIRETFAERGARHADLRQIFLLRRLGRLGPDPDLISVWGAPSYAAAEPLIRTAGQPDLDLVDIGIYRRFGEETL
jgi:hypothetical protein